MAESVGRRDARVDAFRQPADAGPRRTVSLCEVFAGGIGEKLDGRSRPGEDPVAVREVTGGLGPEEDASGP